MTKDYDEMKRMAEQEHREKFDKGLTVFFGYLPPNMRALDWLKQALVSHCEEIEAGEVCVGKYRFWEPVDYVLGFNMSYAYPDPEPPDETGCYFVYDDLPEIKDKSEIRKLILRYLMGCAKKARQVGSDTYGFWRDLIIRVKFEASIGDPHEVMELVYTNLCRLWVDSQTAIGD